MIARLWMQQIKQGTKTYDQVPRQLKGRVKDLLIAEGFESLVTE